MWHSIYLLTFMLLAINVASIPVQKSKTDNEDGLLKKRRSTDLNDNGYQIDDEPNSADETENYGVPYNEDSDDQTINKHEDQRIDWRLLTDLTPDRVATEMRDRRKRSSGNVPNNNVRRHPMDRLKRNGLTRNMASRNVNGFMLVPSLSVDDRNNQQLQLTENDLKKLAWLIQDMQHLNDIENSEDVVQLRPALNDYVVMGDEDNELKTVKQLPYEYEKRMVDALSRGDDRVVIKYLPDLNLAGNTIGRRLAKRYAEQPDVVYVPEILELEQAPRLSTRAPYGGTVVIGEDLARMLARRENEQDLEQEIYTLVNYLKQLRQQ